MRHFGKFILNLCLCLSYDNSMAHFASWNVNGLRACVKNGFLDWVTKNSFDVIGLQEVRADLSQIPKEVSDLPGYFKFWFPATSKKGYSGVGILTRNEPTKIHYGMGIEEFDKEGRVIAAEFKDCVFLSVYFPNSQDKGARIDYKIAFCEALMKFAEKFERGGKAVVVCGDFNIAHEPIDLARPDDNEESPGYLPAEREWMGHFLAEGWIDTFRHFYPRKENAYSWWSARTRARERNIGWRIDYHAVNADAKVRIKGAGIQDQVMGSDHCPVTLELSATL